MQWSALAATGLACLSVTYLVLAAFVWRHRTVVAARPLIAMLLATKIWTICYALELSSRTVEVAEVWSALKFVGIVALPPALWSFVWEFTGKGRLPRWAFRLLLIEPVLVLGTLALPGTRDWFHVYQGDLLLGAPVPASGWAFWPHAVYTYVLMMSAVIALLLSMTRIAHRYRRQGFVLVGASVLPMVGNVIWNALFGDDVIDPTPGLFGITAAVLVWGFFRLRLLDLMPVARGVVVEQMNDAVLVLDVYGRVADANPAAVQIVGGPRSVLIGRAAADLLPGLGPVLSDRRPGDTGVIETEFVLPARARPPLRSYVPLPGRLRRPEAVPRARGAVESMSVSVIPAAGVELPGPQPNIREIFASITGVKDAMGSEIALILALRDVTERNRAERRIRALLEEQTRLSDTLRQSLLPASLPEVAGLELAARFVPAPGGDVGGDFYDVHPTSDGRWAFVLGDVSGKGVHAAVVTSTARYTVRTLSAQGWSPREVLEQLNVVLLSEQDPERFCTVVYGKLDPPSSRDGSVSVTLALGGHPPPMLRRRDGGVQQVGVPGTVLGMQHDVLLHEVTVKLFVGDVLLAYTDGVTEARTAGRLLGEGGLAAVLARLPAEQEAKLAQSTVDSVLAALAAYAPGRDDVALLALAVTG
jgi:serine phosphatase RsbU (regulator of sigma subunit)